MTAMIVLSMVGSINSQCF